MEINRGIDYEALIRLDLASVLSRFEAARRAATVWNVITIAFGGLLWLWLQAPSFNLLPGLIRAFLVVISVLGYGLFGFANSSVSNAADYVNIGYGIIVGPIVLFFIAFGWKNAESHAANLQSTMASHPTLAGVPESHLKQSSKRIVSFLLACVALLGSSFVATNRFFSLRAHESDFLCSQTVNACVHENYWADPWPNARNSKMSWLRPTVGNDWCVSAAPGWPPGFRAVLPDGYFTQQIERLPKYKCVPGKEHPVKSTEDRASDALGRSGGGLRGVIRDMFLSAIAKDPYEQFPYVYPLINLLLLLIFAAGQIYLLFSITRLRGYKCLSVAAGIERLRRWRERIAGGDAVPKSAGNELTP